MENTQQVATVTVQTPNREVTYQGECSIDGVPNTAAPIEVTFENTAGSTCGSLLPSGSALDVIDGVEVTLIDNGMPVVVLKASDFGLTGQESRDELETNSELKQRLESIRLQAGPKMNLGDVTNLSVPKMSLISPASSGGMVSTRTFIPHRCHASIGVLGAVSVATACLIPSSPANQMVASLLENLKDQSRIEVDVEHPIGKMTIVLNLDNQRVYSAANLRTARKLFDGVVFA